MKKFLIVRSDRIGDVVLTLPMAKLLKKHFGEAQISFMCDTYAAPVVRLCPEIDEVIEIRKSGSKIDIAGNIRLLKGKTFDNVFVVSSEFRLAFIMKAAGFRKITGNGYRLYSFLYTHKIYDHRSKVEKHELEYNLSMLSSEFSPAEISRSEPVTLSVPENVKSAAREILLKAGANKGKKNIIIHPGSGGSSVDLPLTKMNELARQISALGECNLIITGSSKESKQCEIVAAGTGAIIVQGNLSLDLFAGLISCTDLLIANSTGPLHIASALGLNTIGFYSKIRVLSTKRWGPYSSKGYTFEPEIDCSDCTREQCERLDCMNTIDTKKVLNLVTRILNVGIQE
ncbi:MAG: glycosyltransferase family 9 protein [Ignavibacteriaceae bacterium]|nr:glycosyltransferase family 9 protein [Ignavibacteriaceae bacterium]